MDTRGLLDIRMTLQVGLMNFIQDKEDLTVTDQIFVNAVEDALVELDVVLLKLETSDESYSELYIF